MLLQLALQLLGGALLTLLAYILINPVNLWRYRHIPGPRYRPLVGNLPEFVTLSSHEFFSQCHKKYGKIFKIWFGTEPWVIVADAELGRKVNYKFLNRPRAIQNPLNRGKMMEEQNKGLFFSRNDMWRTLHKAWEPAFYPDSVSGYSPLMRACGKKLGDRLELLAEEGAPVNVWREVGDLTMAVVGKAAFGVDFNTIGASSSDPTLTKQAQQPQPQQRKLEDGQQAALLTSMLPTTTTAAPATPVPTTPAAAAAAEDEQQLNGRRLVEAAKAIFASTAVDNQSWYATLARLLPAFLRAPVVLMAYAFPDKRLRSLAEAQQAIFSACLQLINMSRKAAASTSSSSSPRAASPERATTPTDDGAAAGGDGDGSDSPPPTPSSTSSSPRAGAVVRVSARRRGPIAPGSFLGLLLSTKDKLTGHSLTELSMVLQASTFVLAGYETTANALSYALFCLATNPEAEARLRRELKEGLADGQQVAPQELEKRFPYLCAVVSEALRLYPPGASTTRESGEVPLELGGVTIPPNTALFVASYSIHHDPQYWPRPEEFLPERWLPGNAHLASSNPAAYLPFGSGPRMCIGYRFALLEIQLTLLELCRRFEFEVHWPSMVPPHSNSNRCKAGEQEEQEEGERLQQQQQQLRLMNGLTLSPVGGIWMRVRSVAA